MNLLPYDHLDLPLCLSSGQTFRFSSWPLSPPPLHNASRSREGGNLEGGPSSSQTHQGLRPTSLDSADGEGLRAGRQTKQNAVTGAGHDSWIGADGDVAFRFEPGPDGWTVEGDADKARAFFRMEIELPALQAKLLALEPRLEPCVALLPGLRMLRPSDPWEVLCSFLCTANNHLPRITAMVQRLAGCGPELASFEGQNVHRFPAPTLVAAIGESQLRAWGFGYRGKTIPQVAAQVAEWGPAWAEDLRREGYEAAWQRLMTLPGVGPKVADCVCLYGLNFNESAPLDTHLWNAAAALYAPDEVGQALTDLRYRRMGERLRGRFGDLTGWAHLYLYFHRLRTWRQA